MWSTKRPKHICTKRVTNRVRNGMVLAAAGALVMAGAPFTSNLSAEAAGAQTTLAVSAPQVGAWDYVDSMDTSHNTTYNNNSNNNSSWCPTTKSSCANPTDRQGRFYVIGGHNGSDNIKTVERYDPATDTWTAVAPLNTARSRFTTAMDNQGRIYAIGGVGAPNSVERYDPAGKNEWETLPPLSVGRRLHQTAADQQGRIYVMGGRREDGIRATEVERFDPAKGEWELLESMKDSRMYASVVVDNQGRINVIGGLGASTPRNGERFDPATGKWEDLPAMPEPRSYHASVVDAQGRIYVIGGGTDGNTVSRRVFRYDPSNNNGWGELDSIEGMGFYPAVAVDASNTVFATGSTNLGQNRLVARYDANADKMLTAEADSYLKLGRIVHNMGMDAGGSLYVFGGDVAVAGGFFSTAGPEDLTTERFTSGNPIIFGPNRLRDKKLQPGDGVTVSITLTNSGDTALRAPTTLAGPAGWTVTQDDAQATILAPGATKTYTARWTAPATVKTETLTNVFTSSSAPATCAVGDIAGACAPIVSSTSVSLETQAETPALSITSTVSPQGPVNAGDTLTYTTKVRNTGTTDFRDLRLTSPHFADRDAKTTQNSVLAAGDTLTVVTTLQVNKSDASTRSIAPTFTLMGAPLQCGVDVCADGVVAQSTAPTVSVNVYTVAATATSFVSTLTKDALHTGLGNVGDAVSFTALVKNTGTSPIGTLSVTSPRGAYVCNPAVSKATPLAVGATTTCTLPYNIKQADVSDARTSGDYIMNETVTVIPTALLDTTVGSPAPASVKTPLAVSNVRLSTAASVAGDPRASGSIIPKGTKVDFTYTVENTGNIPLEGINVLVQESTGGSIIPLCDSNDLAVSGTTTCSASVVM